MDLASMSLGTFFKLNLFISSDSGRVFFDQVQHVQLEYILDKRPKGIKVDSIISASIFDHRAIEQKLTRKAKNKQTWAAIGAIAGGLGAASADNVYDRNLAIVGGAGTAVALSSMAQRDLALRNYLADSYLRRTSIEPGRPAVGYVIWDNIGYKDVKNTVQFIQFWATKFRLTIQMGEETYPLLMEVDERALIYDIERLN